MTDIEGSTNLLQALGDRYPQLLADHYRVLREAFGHAGGAEVSTAGDALFFAFVDATSAVRAAFEGQRGLTAHDWPTGTSVRVRMGIHSGEGKLLGGDYVGLDVHRAARIASAAHGGQVLVSDAARALAESSLPEGASLRDLGMHRLKDLERSERLFQLVAPGIEAEYPPLRSAGHQITNLPAQITSFVGRKQEKEQLVELLRSSRLVTLTGPGGTGKTRLALEVAAGALDEYPDGVFFVPLATITDHDLFVTTVAAELGLRDSPARPIHDALVAHLRDRAVLIVLDNFEQLMPAAPSVGELLAIAPGLRVLVTSREALRIGGEQEFPVPPLALPAGSEQARSDVLEAVDSVALFVQRARLVRPGFELTAANARTIVETCARLDGLPLAIELAAARTRLFEPGDLLRRLDQRLAFLAGGRDVPERQRTLRRAIDWSHDLLDEPEQILFRRMSVFAGGCTLEEVEAVCMPLELALDAVDAVSALYDKSLLRRDEPVAGGLRMAMLETIREYARERLEASGEASEVQKRYAAFFAGLAERVAEQLTGPKQQEGLDTLDRELDNFRAAIRWAVDAEDFATGTRMAAALSRFWVLRNHAMEGRRHLEDLLALPPRGESPATRAAALGAAADVTGWQGDYGISRRLAEAALEIYREVGDTLGIARQLSAIGYATVISDPVAALRLFMDSIAAFREAGAPPEMGGSLVGMALPEMQSRNLAEAARHLEEARALFEQAGDDTMALIPAGLLGLCARLDGDLEIARQRYLEVLLRAQHMGAHIALTLPLQALADLAMLEGDAAGAAILDAGQSQLAERLGGAPPFQLMGIPEVSERARAQLGDEQYEAASAAGRAAPLDELIAHARAISKSSRANVPAPITASTART